MFLLYFFNISSCSSISFFRLQVYSLQFFLFYRLKRQNLHILEKKEAVPIFFNKRAQEEKPEDILMDTEVYSCAGESCNGWMRKDFASDDLLCPLCGTGMTAEVRELPKI
ncbi:cold-shock protein [Bacillus infantis]|uniref:cold-shock protein n=1 Tax=Bacillus infantis TaxID=324767 RepID=UPI003D2EC32E